MWSRAEKEVIRHNSLIWLHNRFICFYTIPPCFIQSWNIIHSLLILNCFLFQTISHFYSLEIFGWNSPNKSISLVVKGNKHTLWVPLQSVVVLMAVITCILYRVGILLRMRYTRTCTGIDQNIEKSNRPKVSKQTNSWLVLYSMYQMSVSSLMKTRGFFIYNESGRNWTRLIT